MERHGKYFKCVLLSRRSQKDKTVYCMCPAWQQIFFFFFLPLSHQGSPGFPDGASGKETNAGDVRDTGLIPGLEKSPGGGHSNPLQYSCQILS